MMRSLFSGVAGLKTHQTKMDVIGNNISNVNTVAFKSSSTTFSDIMYQTTSQASGATATRGGTNAKQIGLGVTNGATKISITSSGAAQSTGDALDIRLTDTNTTNFFIVNNGSENVFTRAGSFYIDGNGNLAMTTTGYLVMGWQVDTTSGTPVVVKDTVSALRVMQADNLTSAPEATTQANFSGVVDKNDSQFNSSTGYMRSFTFYDNLGYTYTAKFAIKRMDGTEGTYTIELANVYDSDNNDILKEYLDEYVENNAAATATDAEKAQLRANALALVFGAANNPQQTYSLLEGFTATKLADGTVQINDGTYNYTFDGTEFSSTETTNKLSLAQVCGLPAGTTVTGVSYDNSSSIKLTIPSTSYSLGFNTKEGYLTAAGITDNNGDITGEGNTTLMFNASVLGPNRPDAADLALSDITVDFSKLMNYDNGGTSTVVANRGATDGTTGTGKKLGTMTGLSVSNDGRIFGSYSNGNTVLLGQIAVAQFANASGLEELGDNCYKTTLNSGDFDGIGVDISADGSSMNTGQLEMANVDLSAEFTDMITTQRGFQANSRIITVSDTMLEELINLKR